MKNYNLKPKTQSKKRAYLYVLEVIKFWINCQSQDIEFVKMICHARSLLSD